MIRNIVFAAAFVLSAAPALASPQLAQQHSCTSCHTADKKIVGPSWNEIAKKYAGDAGAEAALAAKVKKGGGGVWGPVPMPPNVTVKDADIQALVKFVLGHK
jgi:cytochrome c